jgi:hypothetical protein
MEGGKMKLKAKFGYNSNHCRTFGLRYLLYVSQFPFVITTVRVKHLIVC